MRSHSYWFVLVLFPLLLIACTPQDTAGVQAAGSKSELVTCPVTQPPDPAFIPPEAYPSSPPEETFWFGTQALWTALPMDGGWYGLPKNSRGSSSAFTQKVFWWREGYSNEVEPQPALTVTGERLDGLSGPLHSFAATNAFAEDIGSAMLVGLDFPEAGCWEITGRYQEAELSFVVWVEP